MVDRLSKSLLAVILTSRILDIANADLIPTAPGPGQSFNAGSNCTIIWDVDHSGLWTNVTIDLMSGSNTNMSLVTNVISGLDGTDPGLTPYNWTCPEVDPYSAIYFYQFTNDGQTGDAKWTTRFTIASPKNETSPPSNDTQPSGDAIPWGTGQLAMNNITSGNSATASVVSSCDVANLPHLEQINIQDLHSKPADDDDDDDTSSTPQYGPSRSHESDESHDNDDKDSSNGATSKGAEKGSDKGDNEDKFRGSGGDSDNISKSSSNDSGDRSGESNSGAGFANVSSASRAKNTASVGGPVKTISKTKGASAAPHLTNAVVGSPPTPALPFVQKNTRPTSTMNVSSGTTPATSAARDGGSSGTCQCSPDRAGGLQLVSGEIRKQTASLCMSLCPLLFVLILVH